MFQLCKSDFYRYVFCLITLFFSNIVLSADISSGNVKSSLSKINRGVTTNLIYFKINADHLLQSIKIEKISNTKINFKIELTGRCNKIVEGVASKVQGDYEMDEDENGDMYPSESYIHNNKEGYWLNVRLSAKTKNYAQDKVILMESGGDDRCSLIAKVMHLVKL